MADETKEPRTDLSLVARLGAKARRYADQLKAATQRAEAAESRIKALEAGQADLEKRADTSAAAKRVTELEGQLRDLKHRDVIAGLAKDAGMRPEAVKDFLTLSGYKATADDVDAEAVKALIESQRAERSWMFGETAPAAGDKAAEKPAPKPGPGAGKGGSTTIVPELTNDQLSDPVFVMKNWDRVQSVYKARQEAGLIS